MNSTKIGKAMHDSTEIPSKGRLPHTQKGELGLGCWAFGDPYWHKAWSEDRGDPSDVHRSSVRVLRRALTLGIHHFDTAQGYANGSSEQVVGQQLRKMRKDMTIATKTYLRPADTVRGGIEKSLKRMETSYI